MSCVCVRVYVSCDRCYYIYVSACIRVSTLVSTMVSRILPGRHVLRQYQLCTNICLVRNLRLYQVPYIYIYKYLLYISFNTRCILASSQPKISLGLNRRTELVMMNSSFKRTQYQDHAGMSQS
jgi:hypothetical protein